MDSVATRRRATWLVIGPAALALVLACGGGANRSSPDAGGARDGAAPGGSAGGPSAGSSGSAGGASATPGVADASLGTVDGPGDAGVGCPLYGTAAGLYLDGQGPGTAIGEDQARSRLSLLAPYTRWVRFYSALSGYSEAACIAKKEMGKSVALGASIGRDDPANDRELAALIVAANQGCVDIAVVGSETLLRQDQSPAALIALMRRVKSAVPANVQVATADVYNRLTDEVMAAEDVVLAHIYPFWENIPPTYALAMLHSRYQALKTHVAPKSVVVAETGWPSGGRADATPENAATYLVQLASWSRALDVPTFVFSGFDEMWKTNEGAVGPFWGYFTSAGELKSGTERALIGCESSPDVWSGTTVVGGSGTADLVFTSVPPRGSTAALQGRIEHAVPADNRVAAYILVDGGWWSKPTADMPASSIWPDGTFQIAVATGGNDTQAGEIRAFLLPATMAPPVAAGETVLSAALAQFPMARATR